MKKQNTFFTPHQSFFCAHSIVFGIRIYDSWVVTEGTYVLQKSGGSYVENRNAWINRPGRTHKEQGRCDAAGSLGVNVTLTPEEKKKHYYQ